MSFYHFLASDHKLSEIENPNVETLSINEAMERNIKVADFLLEDESIDRDEEILLYSESEEELYELEITNELYFPREYAEEYSNKKYFSEIHGRYSEKRAQELLLYLVKEMKTADEIEVWRVQDDEYMTPEIRTVDVSDLEIRDLNFLDFNRAHTNSICLVIHK